MQITINPYEQSPLPEEHPLRNTPLQGFQSRTFEYRGEGVYKWSLWKTCQPSWPIAKKTFNELGAVWTTNPPSEWREPKKDE